MRDGFLMLTFFVVGFALAMAMFRTAVETKTITCYRMPQWEILK